MKEILEEMVAESVVGQERVAEMMEKLFAVTEAGVVFSEPMTVEGQTIITASEIAVGMGLGFGVGAGSSDPKGHGKGHKADEGETSEGEESEIGVGGGGGGGGGANGRPVAVISISEEGVQVEPVVDATKIALAFFTALGSMFFMLSKMRKAGK